MSIFSIITSGISAFVRDRSDLAAERLTGALLDRLTLRVHVIEMPSDSYRPRAGRARRKEMPQT